MQKTLVKVMYKIVFVKVESSWNVWKRPLI